ncbi:hypothetical protein Taro_013862 [Colocasia esculenta]|uniref:Uncharacterized protein n=1 Tax=Colocasia esculenta TaxID=4460 RepID=A0A843UCW8_COLES|nr:hypothetical protein [Colocasia esculenta]
MHGNASDALALVVLCERERQLDLTSVATRLRGSCCAVLSRLDTGVMNQQSVLCSGIVLSDSCFATDCGSCVCDSLVEVLLVEVCPGVGTVEAVCSLLPRSLEFLLLWLIRGWRPDLRGLWWGSGSSGRYTSGWAVSKDEDPLPVVDLKRAFD